MRVGHELIGGRLGVEHSGEQLPDVGHVLPELVRRFPGAFEVVETLEPDALERSAPLGVRLEGLNQVQCFGVVLEGLLGRSVLPEGEHVLALRLGRLALPLVDELTRHASSAV